MANTTNLNLVKPAGTDYALVSVINGNMDIIDNKVGAVPSNASVQGQIDTLNNQIASLSLYLNSASDVTSAYSDMNANETRVVLISAQFMYSLGLGDSGAKGTAAKLSTYLDCEVATATGQYYTIRFNGSTGAVISSSSISNQLNSFETVTSANANITVLKGGYKQFGKLTLICISIRATANISATTAIIGVPAAWQANAPLMITKPGQSPNILDAECRVYNGYIYPGVALATGSEYTIQGMYIAS